MTWWDISWEYLGRTHHFTTNDEVQADTFARCLPENGRTATKVARFDSMPDLDDVIKEAAYRAEIADLKETAARLEIDVTALHRRLIPQTEEEWERMKAQAPK